MSSKEHKEKIWNMISDIGVGMLVSLEGDDLYGRPMQIVQKEYNGTLYFYTSVDSEKTDQVLRNSSVCITFSCPNKKTYVSMTGTATINSDQKLIEKFWSPFVSAWFPEEKTSPNCKIIEVKIKSGAHWDSELSSLEYLYEVGKANLTQTTPASSKSIEHESFS